MSMIAGISPLGQSQNPSDLTQTAKVQEDSEFEQLIKEQLVKSQIGTTQFVMGDVSASILQDEEGEAVT